MGDVEMADATQPQDYVISRILMGHTGEVKTVASTSQGMLLSGGRDETVKMWIGRGGDYSEHESLVQSPKGAIVYAVAFYEDDDGWKLFIGRKDGVIAVYGSGHGNEPIMTVKHHTSVVSCLYVDSKNRKLISGSWDNHLIIWPIADFFPNNDTIAAFMCVGHTMSVWSVTSIESRLNIYLSASADQTIRLWENDKSIREFRGHSDVVRALVVIDSTHFISASNDFSIILWNIEESAPLARVKAPQEEFIYSMTRVDKNTVVTCGESGHIVVWNLEDTKKKGFLTQVQMMSTPVASLWSVCALPNSDIALGSSDGRIFVLTRDENRIAPIDIRENLDAEMAARISATIQQQMERESDTVTIKVALDDGNPNMELKYVKGTDPSLAAEKFITDNNLPISYLNEITEYIKANIPEARNFVDKKIMKNTVGANGKQSFSIIVEDGRQLTCTFDHSDDPDIVAQEFVETHNLPIKYLATTSQMIRKEQRSALSSSSSQFYDPFTGGGRYVPGGGNDSFGNGMNSAADPLTGGGRYIPGQSSMEVTPSVGDPLTSEGRYIPGAAKDILMPNASLPIDKKKPRGELCPLSQYFTFGAEQFSQKAFDRLLSDNAKTSEAYRLGEEQLNLLKELAMKGPQNIVDLDMLINTFNIGLNWNMTELLPVFDLFRIGILNETINRYYAMGEGSEDFRQRLLALLVSDSPEPLKAVVCRTMCNLFTHESGRKMASSEMKTLMPVIGSLVLSSRPALQSAAASALSNWAYLLLETSDSVMELGPREDGIREIVKVLESQLSFGDIREDVLTRVLQAISTLMWGDTTVIKLAKSRKIVDIVNRIKDAVVDERGKSLCRDIVEMTYAV